MSKRLFQQSAAEISRAIDLDAARRELRIATHRNGVLLELRHGPADYRGECDACHADPVAVWEDRECPGGFGYCAPCLDRLILRTHAAIRAAVDRCKAAGGKRCQSCGDFHRKDQSCDCIDPPGVS